MEFLDEDARPRFLFQSRPNHSSPTNPQTQSQPTKPFLFLTISISSIFLALSIFFIQSEPFKSILLWVALSLLIGPFAPISITGGDIRVGEGPVVEFPNQEPQTEDDSKKRVNQKRPKPHKNEENFVGSAQVLENIGKSVNEERKNRDVESKDNGIVELEEEKEWNEEDIDILKKQLVKHPVGKPRRWEVISEAFRGRHKVGSVIKMAKELGERKFDDGDPYTQFLKKRKNVDKRVENGNEDLGSATPVEKEVWSSGEDIALLNALKAFPKDVSMRWEKIAAAVPGKSKAACMKRVSELKKGFRNAKAANVGLNEE